MGTANVKRPRIITTTVQYQKEKIIVSADTTQIDTASIVPGSLVIKSDTPLDFYFNYAQSKIFWRKKPPAATLDIEYRVFPFSNQSIYRRLSFDSIFYKFGAAPQKSHLKNSMPNRSTLVR